jgi:hypothetical protein
MLQGAQEGLHKFPRFPWRLRLPSAPWVHPGAGPRWFEGGSPPRSPDGDGGFLARNRVGIPGRGAKCSRRTGNVGHAGTAHAEPIDDFPMWKARFRTNRLRDIEAVVFRPSRRWSSAGRDVEALRFPFLDELVELRQLGVVPPVVLVGPVSPLALGVPGLCQPCLLLPDEGEALLTVR